MIKTNQYFLDNRSNIIEPLPSDNEILRFCREHILDEDYFIFINEIGNGGFFFGQSMQIYCLNDLNNFLSIKTVNEVLVKQFDTLFEGLFSFGQDIFGNQFSFNTTTNDLFFFNIVNQYFTTCPSTLIRGKRGTRQEHSDLNREFEV